MLLDRSVKLERELKSRIKDCYRESVRFGRTHEEHLQAMRRYVWDTQPYKLSPRWLKTFLHGVDQTCFDMLYEVPLDYHSGVPSSPLMPISIGPDARMFGERDDTWLAESTEYKLALKCVYVWRRQWNEGTFKPFSMAT
jgi:hypothetical protein